MWHDGLPAADQCEGCTYFTGQALELSYLHSRDVTFAVFCKSPFDESNRYSEFMGWDTIPWYSELGSRFHSYKVYYTSIQDAQSS
jgi:predicted dithiol-disulfide oxidoreductase (DUF899 family)